MGHLHRYVFSSCQRLTGGRFGLNLRISESLRAIHFGPDVLPVFGAKVAAGDNPARRSLDGETSSNRHGAPTGAPLCDRWSRYANAPRKFGARHTTTLAKIPELFHAAMVRHCLTIFKALP